ncbi:MAG: glycosyltransferase family 2 protein [Flaviaesturariibacter sp.]|nr:glycosyltransferase family 2 protein [Flaviaesturariibacter sp.]
MSPLTFNPHTDIAAVSVVIITMNEAQTIAGCIASVSVLTDNIIVVDAESIDGTAAIAQRCGATVLVQPWSGYGHARNAGASLARHNWILSIDADERLTASLAVAIRQLVTNDAVSRYRFRRTNFFQEKEVRFGTLGNESVTRLYNRLACSWSLVPVHETLIGRGNTATLRGKIEHYGIGDKHTFLEKKEGYARLSADKYATQGKQASLTKLYFAPMFNAVKSFVFQLGFLDGETGWFLASVTYRYTKQKYRFLADATKQSHHENPYQAARIRELSSG